MKQHDMLFQLAVDFATAAEVSRMRMEIFLDAADACARRDIRRALYLVDLIERETGVSMLSPEERESVVAAKKILGRHANEH